MRLDPEEVAYRRGCHQTAARIYGRLMAGADMEWVGRLEDVLLELRNDTELHVSLLDEACTTVDREGIPA